MTAIWDYPNPFLHLIKVHGKDIDGLGHTNNANYVIWCEQCAWMHSESLGLSVTDYQRLDRGLVINKGIYEYFQPSFKNEELMVGTWLTACDNRLRLERRFQIINRSSQDTLLRGHWTLICVALSSSKPTRLPAEFIEIYEPAITPKLTSF